MKSMSVFKQFLFLIIAGAIGSACTIAIMNRYTLNNKSAESIGSSVPAQLTSSNLLNSYNAPAMPFSFTEAAEKSMPSVVHIKSKIEMHNTSFGSPFGNSIFDLFGQDFFGQVQPRGNNGQPQYNEATGSGVIISGDGLIVTNNHVIDGADVIEVITASKESYEAKVIGTDPATDIAVIQIEARNLTPIKIADSDNVRVGEWVLAVGNPFNLESTATAGIVSAKGRDLSILKDRAAIESFIQTDAAVNPGNSGGALVNINGDLIGINTAIASPTGAYAGYAFAVPVNIVKKVADDLLAHGIVQRGFLGVAPRDLNSKLAQEKGLNITRGVYLDKVIPNGAGADAGLQEGDVIVKIDGHDTNAVPELQEIVASKRPGDQIEVTINRNGKVMSKYLSLKNKAGNTDLVTKSDNFTSKSLGVTLSELSADDLSELGIDYGVQITDIGDGKIARYTNIKEGFIITKINERPVKSLDDLNRNLESSNGSLIIEGKYPGRNGSYYYAFDL
jgi:serine protease Do